MYTVEQLIQDFETTTWIINKQAEGLTNEQMLLQPPFRSNCFNWVLGHITVNRDKVLALLDESPNFKEAEVALYIRGSEPVTADGTALPGSTLLAALNDANKRIAAALPQADLTQILNEENRLTLANRIGGLHWHETYHTGQLELLRQVAGTNDAVIR